MIKKILEKHAYYDHFIPNVVLKNQDYLRSGIYRLDSYGELVSHCGAKSVITNSFWGIKSIGWQKKIVRLLMVKLWSRKIVVHGGALFNGQALKYSEDGVVKIFDFEGKEVVTILPTNQIALEMKKNHDYFASYFNTTNMTLFDLNVIREDYIELNKIDSGQKFELLLESYGDYFEALKNRGKLDLDYRILKSTQVVDQFVSDETVVLRCHGDCWASNIIYNNGVLYFIDYDRNGQYFFLYDLMTYMYCETVFNHNPVILDNFIGGIYDSYIAKYYEIFELKWDGSKINLMCQFKQSYFKAHLATSEIRTQRVLLDYVEKALNLLQ